MALTNSLQTQAYNTLKGLILSNRLDTDKLYSETQLAKTMGISRTPLREALQCLSQDGYITIIPSSGFKIRKLDANEAKMIIEVRCAIEGFCIHSIISRKSNASFNTLIDELQTILDNQKTALTAPDFPASFIENDHQFHLLLVHYLENTEFNTMYQRLMYMIHLTTTNILSHSGRAEATYAEHSDIFNYIKSGESDKAYEALMYHLLMPLSMDINSIEDTE